METKFKLGDNVFSFGDRYHTGEVVDIEVNDQLPDPDVIYHVRWEASGETRTYYEDDEELRLADPKAEAQLKADLALRIKAMTSRFEQAFSMWQEIQDLCHEAGDSIYSYHDDPDLGPLMEEFESTAENGGWSRSSLYC